MDEINNRSRIASCKNAVNYYSFSSLATLILVIFSTVSARAIYFYRTMCVSAVFAVSRCPSVRLSDTFVHSIQAAKDIVKLLRRPGNPIILVF